MPADLANFGLRTWHFGLRISRTAALSLLLLLSLLPAAAQSKTNSRPARPDLASFKLITDRNIFSPSRTPSRPMRYESRSPSTQPTRRGDYFTLVGTMEYEKGAFAFFDGTISDYRKTLKPRDTIAGYKVAEIAQNFVRLAGETNTLELKVGMQMRHSESGGWSAVMPTETSIGSSSYSSSYSSRSSRSYPTPTNPPPVSPSASPGLPGGEGQPLVVMTEDGPTVVMPPGDPTAAAPDATNAPAAQAAPAAAGGEDEVLRRLMQRREQEMNR